MGPQEADDGIRAGEQAEEEPRKEGGVCGVVILQRPRPKFKTAQARSFREREKILWYQKHGVFKAANCA